MDDKSPSQPPGPEPLATDASTPPSLEKVAEAARSASAACGGTEPRVDSDAVTTALVPGPLDHILQLLGAGAAVPTLGLADAQANDVQALFAGVAARASLALPPPNLAVSALAPSALGVAAQDNGVAAGDLPHGGGSLNAEMAAIVKSENESNQEKEKKRKRLSHYQYTIQKLKSATRVGKNNSAPHLWRKLAADALADEGHVIVSTSFFQATGSDRDRLYDLVFRSHLYGQGINKEGKISGGRLQWNALIKECRKEEFCSLSPDPVFKVADKLFKELADVVFAALEKLYPGKYKRDNIKADEDHIFSPQQGHNQECSASSC